MTDRLPLVELLREMSRRGYWPLLGDEAADELDRMTRELAELKADRDSWIEQASQRAQETVEAMQQVEAYRLRCEALHSAPREPLTDEQVDALWKEPMSADWEHREFARAIERAIASQPVAQREPLTDEQCDSIYSALHEWAQECDRHELGLPMFGDEKTRGREVIRRAIERAISSQPVAQREPLTDEQIANAARWRYWRNYWPALCRMEVARFAGLDLRTTYVQDPAGMDRVTDEAMTRRAHNSGADAPSKE